MTEYLQEKDCPDIPKHDHNGIYVRSQVCELKQGQLELKLDAVKESVAHLKETMDLKLRSNGVMMKVILSVSSANLLALGAGIIKLVFFSS